MSKFPSARGLYVAVLLVILTATDFAVLGYVRLEDTGKGSRSRPAF